MNIAVSERLRGKVFQADGAENGPKMRMRSCFFCKRRFNSDGLLKSLFHSYTHSYMVYSSKYVLRTYYASCTF